MVGTEATRFAVGQPVPRTEDPRLLTGRGRYVDDLRLPGMARAFLLRSPYAHARLRGIDAAAATAMPGVLAVLTGADLCIDGPSDLPCGITHLKKGDGPMFRPGRPHLAVDAVRHVGDPVAMVVAETIAQAKDAAEAIEVDYAPLPAVTDSIAVLEAPSAVWADCPDNVCYVHEVGDTAAVEVAFARAHHTTRLDLVISRVSANSMEPRGCIGDYDAHEGRYTLHAGVQRPWDVRHELATQTIGVAETAVRVVSHDVGGSFGMKGGSYIEYALVLWASRRVGRPVKWISDRGEALVSDNHARDNRTQAELALDADGRFLAVRTRTIVNLGAYLATGGPHSGIGNLGSLAGVYSTPAIHAHVTGVFTNTTQTSAYRGAGRPEAAYVIERLVDAAAREMGIDPVHLRRRNMIPTDAFPFRTGLTFTYDCGDFERTMDMALEAADHGGFGSRRTDAHARGRLRGIGLSMSVEQAAQRGMETTQVRFDGAGTITLIMGSVPHGQGHETTFKQVLCDRLGIDPGGIRFVTGDTDRLAFGGGTFGSRSAALGGTAVARAADRIVDKGRIIAAHLLETAVDDVVFEVGHFTVAGTDRSVGLGEVARAAHDPESLPPEIEAGLEAYAAFKPDAPTFPNGCHVCEVEVDPDTGAVTMERYTVVDDVGTVINPLLLKGQIHGGVAQGAGQILCEQVAYDNDPQSGQLLTASFMDYAMPRADDLPFFEVGNNPVPTAMNPLGVKGAGEAGTVGALPAVMNAILDALAPTGVRHLDMPATAERVWRAIASSEDEG